MGLADGVAWEREYGAPERRTVAGQQPGVSAVEAKPRRFSNDRNPNGLGFSNGVVEDEHGYYVLHSDYEALARKAEALQQEVAELRDVMKDCHAALKMMVTPGDISGSTVLDAFAAATSAECRARALLGGENAE